MLSKMAPVGYESSWYNRPALPSLPCVFPAFADVLGAEQSDRSVSDPLTSPKEVNTDLPLCVASLIELLWNDLTHPVSSYVGAKHKFRSGDGSGNSLQDPQLGAANTRM
jgi:hypothetical protein